MKKFILILFLLTICICNIGCKNVTKDIIPINEPEIEEVEEIVEEVIEEIVFSGTVNQYEYDFSISSDSTPVASATVTILETQEYSITDESGNYSFTSVPEGEFNLEITKESYFPIQVTANSIAGSKNVIVSESFFPFNNGTYVYENIDDETIFKIIISTEENIANLNGMIKMQWSRQYEGFPPSIDNYWIEYNPTSQITIIKYWNHEYTSSSSNISERNEFIIKYPLEVGYIKETEYLSLEGMYPTALTYQVEEKIDSLEINGIIYNDIIKVSYTHHFIDSNYILYYYLAKNIGIIAIKEYSDETYSRTLHLRNPERPKVIARLLARHLSTEELHAENIICLISEDQPNIITEIGGYVCQQTINGTYYGIINPEYTGQDIIIRELIINYKQYEEQVKEYLLEKINI